MFDHGRAEGGDYRVAYYTAFDMDGTRFTSMSQYQVTDVHSTLPKW